MKIGDILKAYRVRAGLTQEQMTGGVVSESFYSKVERGIHKIDVDTLVEMLQANGFSTSALFMYMDEEAAKKEDSVQQASEYYTNASPERKAKLFKKTAERKDIPKWQRDVYRRLQARMEHTIADFTEEEKEEFKRRILVGNWDTLSYNSLGVNMFVLDFADLYELVNLAYQSYNPVFPINSYQLHAAEVPIVFLRRCYFDRVDKKYTKTTFDFINKKLHLEIDTEFAKVLGGFWQALYDDDQEKLDKFIDVIYASNMSSTISDVVADYRQNRK